MRHISLLYHDVVSGGALASSGFAGADADSYKLDEAAFCAHLDRIGMVAEARIRLIGHSGEVEPATERAVLLTFDDGGASADEPTAGLLEARGWRGHFYIVTERIGQPGFLSATQIRRLHERGHHIGSHSHSHPPRISELGDAALLHEWSESRRILALILGEAPFSVSVPGGFYSRRVAQAVHASGYSVLFNSEPTSRVRRVAGLAVLGRYSIKRNTTPDAAQALARGSFGPRARQALMWNAKKPLKKLGGRAWLHFRRWVFARGA